MQYGFNHEGKTFTPDGTAPVRESQEETDARNRELERAELEWIKTGPERLFLYVKHPSPNATVFQREGNWTVTTWLGTHVGIARVTQRYRMGFGYGSYRRAITARIEVLMDGEAGERGLTKWVDYHGWYFESSGDYCRLKRGKW